MPRFGERNHNATLSDSDVRNIRNSHMAYVAGRSYKSIAAKYGVGISTIRDIVTFRTRRSA